MDVATLQAQVDVRDGGDGLASPGRRRTLADALDEQGGDTASATARRAGVATGVSFFSWSMRVAVTMGLQVLVGEGLDMERAAGLVRRFVGWASRLVVFLWSVPGGAGKGIKKAGGPIWPTARGLSGRRSCRLRLARDGHRSPACAIRDGRNASGGEERLRHHSSRLL